MKTFTFYSSETGDIFCSCSMPAAEIAENTPENCSVYDGYINGQTHMIVNGEPVEKPPAPVVESEIDVEREMRIIRNRLLLASDWTQMPDAPLTEAQRAEWAAYRQALRDVPQDNQSATSIDDIIWPTKPE